MFLLIPLGGLGTRFSKFGYNKPKPLVNVMGKPIIEWLLDNLIINNISKIIIPYNSVLEKYDFEGHLKKKYNYNFNFIKLDKNTDGSAESIYIALSNLSDSDCPILCLDGDNFYTEDIIKLWNGENCVFAFEDTTIEPIYSYIKFDNNITDIQEKNKISNFACSGGYGFNSWYSLKKYCKFIIDNNIKQKNEYYTSTVIKEMLNNNILFKPKIINSDNWICLGTPLHVKIFCNNFPVVNALNNKHILTPKRFCFDLDNTLVSYPEISNDYSTVKPITKNINILRYLKKLGNYIIIYTARRMKTYNGNNGKILADIGKITFDTLEKFNIPYDEIYFGKPYADFYIDDLGISSFSDLEKELGYYQSSIIPRDFNQISSYNIQVFRKSSNDLSGEIYYYRNIPIEVKDMFPILINYDINYKWYDMEKINGIPVSKIYLSKELTTQLLDHIIGTLHRLHKSNIDNLDKNINIYLNYSKKLINRYSNYDYSKFPNNKLIYDKLLFELNNYEQNNLGKLSIIHGDSVFTNILINNFGKIKFIDMRGKLDNNLTMLGDVFYDWAKLYQSLLGYDEILQDIYLDIEYKNILINHFKSKFIELYSEQQFNYLKLITNSLLFTLIPLHDNNKCIKYYNLINL